MSFHFCKSRRWRRVGSLVCHLEAGEDKNICLLFAIKSQNYAGVKIIVKAPPVTVLSWGETKGRVLVRNFEKNPSEKPIRDPVSWAWAEVFFTFPYVVLELL